MIKRMKNGVYTEFYYEIFINTGKKKMKLSKLFAVAAIGLAVALTGCGPSTDAPAALSHSQNTMQGDFISTLPDGLHEVSIPNPNGDGGQDCLIIKDASGYKGYVVNLGCETNPEATSFEFNTIAQGDLISRMQDGVNDLEIDGQHFEDGIDRNYTIVKDASGYKGYAFSTGYTQMP